MARLLAATCCALFLAHSSSASWSTCSDGSADHSDPTTEKTPRAADDDSTFYRPLALSFLQAQLETFENHRMKGDVPKHRQLDAPRLPMVVNVSSSKWQNLMSPKDCVSGKSEQDAQACHLENLNKLASAYFSNFPAASVTLDDFEDAFKVMTRAGISTKSCVVQILNNTVWEVGACDAQQKVLSTLLQHATSLPGVGVIPDVEMHVSKYDQTALVLPANGVRAPILAPASVPEARGYIVPVPLNHRRVGSSAKIPDTSDISGYFDICRGKAAFDSTDYGKTIAGEPQCLPQSATPWPSKKNVAFFRGSVYTDSQNCTECRCQTDDGLCYDCSLGCTYRGRGASCARPRARTQCLRPDLLGEFGNREEFDVGSTANFVAECMWELNKYLLVIGNNMGWADRVQDSLFKTSATILVDSGAYEWFYPLMIEDLHLIRADPTVASISEVIGTSLQRDDVDMPHRANAFARLTFGIDNVARYTAMVAKAYSRVQAYKPHKREPASRPCDGLNLSRRKYLDVYKNKQTRRDALRDAVEGGAPVDSS